MLEVGAGTGAVAQRYAAGREVVVVDRSPWCAKALHEKFDDVPNVTVREADVADLADEGERFSSVLLINVLEHIPDDVGTLQSLSGLLEPGGRVVVYVPAMNGLFTKWDRRVGHCRRYSAWRMREVFAAAGLETVEMRYMNLLSIPPWWLFSGSDKTMGNPRGTELWDRTGVRLTKGIESVVRVPVGLNLLAVGDQSLGLVRVSPSDVATHNLARPDHQLPGLPSRGLL